MKANRHTSFRRLPLPLAALSAGLLTVVGALTVASLWILGQLLDQSSQHDAALSVVTTGRRFALELASHDVVSAAEPAPLQWQQFSRMIDALHTIENNLQFVSVTRDGVTLFHKQTAGIGPDIPTPFPAPEPPPDTVSVSRRLLDLGRERVPVMVFSRTISLPDGADATIEVGLKREAVVRKEQVAESAVRAMFRIAVATVVTAFGLCLLLLSWLMRLEKGRERRRRQQEHLAFSGMLANGIVHDFRNPMSSVRLDAQMLARETERGSGPRLERLRELSGRLCRTIERMDQVFKEFLYLSHPGTDTLSQIDLLQCLRECVDSLAGRIEQKSIQVEFDAPTTSNLNVQAAPSALRRALTNVILNAVQFSPNGESVCILTRREADKVIAEVIDKGVGIPPKAQKQVFDMFYSTRPDGTGLGLFLARTAVENCGGRIELLPEKPRGTRVRITLNATNTGDNSFDETNDTDRRG